MASLPRVPRCRGVVVVTILLAAASPEVLSGSASSRPEAVSEAISVPIQVQASPIFWYFWREDCPVCRRAEPWLAELEAAYPELELRRIEVLRDPDGRLLFQQMMEERGRRATAVPTFILGDEVWVGFTPALAEAMEAAIQRSLGEAVRDPPPGRTALDLGPLGRVDLAAQPLAAGTALIAFVDGFNPCSLWVLTVLLGMILGTRSRTRIAVVGLTFLFVTAAIYGIFIAGLFAVLEVAGHMGWIRVAVAILALGFGLVNVKDFLAYGRGFSLTIPDRFKPGIYRGGRALRTHRPLVVTLAITVALAAGVALVELPCTAGFPVLWTTLVSEAGVGRTAFAGLLGLYLFVYLSVEIAILTGALVTLRATRLQEEHGRKLKLVGGMVMIALALVLLVDPSLMERLAGSLLVVSLAVAASLLMLLVQRRIHTKSVPDSER